jgi:serine protease inhibitor
MSLAAAATKPSFRRIFSPSRNMGTVWSEHVILSILNALHLGTIKNSQLDQELRELIGHTPKFESHVSPTGTMKRFLCFMHNHSLPINQAYATFLQKCGIVITPSDFSEKDRVELNQLVSSHTDSLVPNLVEKFDRQTQFVIASTLLVDLKWKREFEQGSDIVFKTSTGSIVNLESMKESVPVVKTTKYVTACVPVTDSRFAVYFTMCAENAKKQKLRFPKHNTIVNELQRGSNRQHVCIPPFSLSSKLNVKEMLSKSVPNLFQVTGDMGGISPGPFQITDFVLKTQMNVTPEGIQAASAGYAAASRSMACNILMFDRPFTVVIVDTATGEKMFSAVFDGVSS